MKNRYEGTDHSAKAYIWFVEPVEINEQAFLEVQFYQEMFYRLKNTQLSNHWHRGRLISVVTKGTINGVASDYAEYGTKLATEEAADQELDAAADEILASVLP